MADFSGTEGFDSSTSPSPPKVSVGVPIYNEASFLEKSLQALVGQDYPNLKIIISDNASTDGTPAICQDFAQRYSSVEYHRCPQNIGAAANFTKVLELADGEFFMWASGHDLWSENFVSQCVQQLQAEPSAVLCYGTCTWIDENGNPLPLKTGSTDTRGMDAVARFFSVFWGNMNPILGLMRLNAAHGVRKPKAMPGADLIFLSELVLRGDFVHATQASWCRREYRHEGTYKQKMKRYQTKDYGLAADRLGKLFPLARLPFELLAAVWRAKIRWSEKLAIMSIMLPAMPVRYFVGKQKPLP